MKKILTLPGLLLGLSLCLSATGQTLVKDIVPGLSGSGPRSLTPIAGGVLFVADDNTAVNGNLWRTDGTTAGTTLVRATTINPNGAYRSDLVKMGAFVYFSATDAATGAELWKSDGTAAGTVLVKDIAVGVRGSGPSCLTVMNNRLYFQAHDNVAGYELWMSDGTAAGTRMVKDIMPGIYGGLSANGGTDMAVLNNNLYFKAGDGLTGDELWKSDGTAAGTVLVKDLVPGSTGCFPQRPTVHNGKVYFTADDRVLGTELYVSDGTAVGTRLVRDINPGGFSANPTDMQGMGNNLYFKATTRASGRELWKTDGTAGGTVLVKDLLPGTGNGVGGFGSNVNYLTAFNGYLYFDGEDGLAGGFNRLYRTDGTAAGTTPFNPATASLISPNYVQVANNTLFFSAYEPTRNPAVGSEPWRSDGTAAGTVFMGDIFPGPNGSYAVSFTYYNGGLLFSASNYDNGQELWRYAATAASTAAARLAPALALWPNPAQGRANAQLPAGLEARELTLTDALGRVVRTQALPPSAGPARHELDLRGLAPGLYVVRCGPAAGQLQVE